MSPKNSSNRLHPDKRKSFLKLFKQSKGTRSLRSLAHETGIAPSTASKILKEEGLSPGKPKGDVPEPRAFPEKEATLRDVAARAKVSVSTASLALRNSSGVSKETRKKVQDAAQKLRYQVHPHVSALLSANRRGRQSKRDEVLVYLFAHGIPDQLAPFDEIMQVPWGPHRRYNAAKAEAESRGYRVDYMDYHDPDIPQERLAKILVNRGIQGILLDAPPQVMLNRPMNLAPFYVVSFQEQTEFRAHLFSNNSFHNSLLLTCKLWERGYRRIGRIQSDAAAIGELYRQDAGYHHAQLHLASPEQRIPTLYLESYAFHLQYWLRYGKWHRARNRADERAWLERQDLPSLHAELYPHRREMALIRNRILECWLAEYQPEVLIGNHFETKQWLNQIGYRVPDDLALAHGNLNEDVAGWSGIRQAEEQLATESVRHLIDRISLGRLEQPETPIRHLFSGSWVAEKTTPIIRRPHPPLDLQAERFIQRVTTDPLAF